MNKTEQIKEIADRAEMIVAGYAFSRKDNFISIDNLLTGDSSMMIDPTGRLIATNMDEIEQEIVLNIWKKDHIYMSAEMEPENAEVLSV